MLSETRKNYLVGGRCLSAFLHDKHEPDCDPHSCSCGTHERAEIGGIMVAEFLGLIRSTLVAK